MLGTCPSPGCSPAQSDICLKPGFQRHLSGLAACRQQHPQLNKPQWANAPGCSIWDVLPLSPAVLLVWPWPGQSRCRLSQARPCPDRINATWGHALGRKCGWRAGPDLSSAWSDSPPARASRGSQTSLCSSWSLPCRALDAASGVWSRARAGGKIIPQLCWELSKPCYASPLIQHCPVMQCPSFSSQSCLDSPSGSSFP